MTDDELAELVSRVGNIYTKEGLSPPHHLRDAARRWLGLTQDEIVTVLEKHFQDCRRLYTCGAGEQHFGLVQQAIKAAWQAKHPTRDQAADEPARQQRRRGIRKVYNASGFPDVIVDGGRAASLLRDGESNIERPSGLVDYADAGEPIDGDEESDA
jgi:hypothetical protein